MIEVRGPVKKYGDTVAVAGLTFDVQPGLVGFLGPTGSGRSTTQRMMGVHIGESLTASRRGRRADRHSGDHSLRIPAGRVGGCADERGVAGHAVTGTSRPSEHAQWFPGMPCCGRAIRPRLAWVCGSAGEAERRVPIGDHEQRVGDHPVVPADDTLDEVEDAARVPAGDQDGEPGHHDQKDRCDV
jgi:energy-coupling factor transporter ATP-binding protein EcfA2